MTVDTDIKYRYYYTGYKLGRAYNKLFIKHRWQGSQRVFKEELLW